MGPRLWLRMSGFARHDCRLRQDAEGVSLLFEPSEQAFRNALEESISIYGMKSEYDKMQANGISATFLGQMLLRNMKPFIRNRFDLISRV